MDGTKRLLIGIPLAALLVGFSLFLWHSSDGRSVPVPRERPRPTDASSYRPGIVVNPSRDGTPPPAPGEAAEPGSMRLFIHADGRGIPAARVTLEPMGRPAQARKFVTGNDGAREMQQMPVGTYLVAAHAPGYVTTRVSVSVQSGRATEVSIGLKQGGTVFGSVENEKGESVAGTRVNLIDNVKRRFIHPDLSAITGPEGEYVIEGVPLGDFGLHARHPEHRVTMLLNKAIHTPDDRLEVNLVLLEGSTVSGRILDAEGRPLPNAAVMAVNEESALIHTGDDGRFELTGLGELPIALSAQKPGFGTEYRQDIPPNSTNVVIRLFTAGQIIVRVDAEPMPKLFTVLLIQFVEALKKEITVQTQTFQQEDGSYLVKNVAPGTYRVEIKAPGYEILDRPQIVVQSGVTAENVMIRLRRQAN